jgi:hypothetical protein
MPDAWEMVEQKPGRVYRVIPEGTQSHVLRPSQYAQSVLTLIHKFRQVSCRNHGSFDWNSSQNGDVLPMTFARQAGAAAVLVTLTLSLQCAGMAALIAWARN